MNLILIFTKDSILTANFILVNSHVLSIRNVVSAHLVWQNCHLIWMIPLHNLAIWAGHRWDEILNLVLEVVVALAQLTLFSVLVIDLDGQSLALFAPTCKLLSTMRDARLSHFIEHLKLVQQLALVTD